MSTKGEHSIRVVSKVTGIAIETLRVWERRYGFPNPGRKEDSNRRLYSDEDIEKLRRVAEALELGFRPSDVIHKTIEEITALLPKGKTTNQDTRERGASPIDVAVSLLESEDIEGLQKELHHNAAALGPKRFVVEFAQPLLHEIGDLWAAGAIGVRQEHLLSECLTTELRLLLSASDITRSTPTVLLATLSGEPHSLGLEMVAVYLAASNAKPRLVGANTPPDQIVDGVKTLRADVVGLSVSASANISFAQEQIESILRDLPRRVSLWVGGEGSKQLQINEDGLRIINSWQQIDDALQEFITKQRPLQGSR
jgi:DNA-binding transcriptional MerR regulator/methylmalonyl-CoA mutase cobalamin-binding subunit